MTATLPSSFLTGYEPNGTDMTQLLTALKAITNIEGVWTIPTVGGTVNTLAYANMPAGTSFNFTKQNASSRLLVFMNWACRTGVAVKQVKAAVNINGTDYQITHQEIPVTAQHWQMSNIRLISGVAAGTYTIQGRWSSEDNTTTFTIDTNDVFSLICWEIPA